MSTKFEHCTSRLFVYSQQQPDIGKFTSNKRWHFECCKTIPGNLCILKFDIFSRWRHAITNEWRRWENFLFVFCQPANRPYFMSVKDVKDCSRRKHWSFVLFVVLTKSNARDTNSVLSLVYGSCSSAVSSRFSTLICGNCILRTWKKRRLVWAHTSE